MGSPRRANQCWILEDVDDKLVSDSRAPPIKPRAREDTAWFPLAQLCQPLIALVVTLVPAIGDDI